MERRGLLQALSTARADLTRFLQARGMSTEDAEDLLQDLYVKIEALDGATVSEPKAYLYRMANNLAHDRRRAEERRKRRDGAWVSSQTGFVGDRETAWNAEEILQARDLLRKVEAVLETLPVRTSLIFHRFRIEGESQKAIATSLGISLSAVEKHLQRAYRVVLDTRRGLDRPDEDGPTHVEEGWQDAGS